MTVRNVHPMHYGGICSIETLAWVQFVEGAYSNVLSEDATRTGIDPYACITSVVCWPSPTQNM